MRDARDVILAPVITEKSMEATMSKKYTFKVAKNAEKVEIAKAAEEIFGVKVQKVNTVSVRGRKRRQGLYVGYTPAWKRQSLLLLPIVRASSSLRA